MALVLKNLQKVAGGAQSLFLYQTPDAIATVIGSGYFANAAAQLKQFDVIMVVGTTGGTPTIDNVFVTSSDFNATPTTSATEGVTAT